MTDQHDLMNSRQEKTDEELIARFQDGDNYAFDLLVKRYKDPLMNFIFRFVGEKNEAEDIVQETFLRLFKNKHYYKEIAKFSTWIYTIAINLAKTKVIKKQKNKVFSLSSAYDDEDKDFDVKDDAYLPDDNANSRFQDELIQKALDSIPENYRKLVILRDIEEFSYEEISEMTGLPMGTVKSRINRGREKLQKLLKDIYKE
jgi:RNA polymerase sigma-70 factor (ECF subfamily)